MVQGRDRQRPHAIVDNVDRSGLAGGVGQGLREAIVQIGFARGVIGTDLDEKILPGPAGIPALVASDRIVGDDHIPGVQFSAAQSHGQCLFLVGIFSGGANLASRIDLVDARVEDTAQPDALHYSRGSSDDRRIRCSLNARFIEHPDLRGR